MRTRPDHINFDNPRGTNNIADFPFTLNPPEPVTDEERELVCQAIDKRGLWSTELPEILGLVDR